MHPVKVRVVKTSGQVLDDVDAGMHKAMVILNDPTLPIEVGDIVERDLPNGLTDKFEITDPSFHAANNHFPAHFQAAIRRVGNVEQPSGITYNLHGNNSRVNVNSEDNSHNVVSSPENVFADMRKEVSITRASRSMRSGCKWLAIGGPKRRLRKRL